MYEVVLNVALDLLMFSRAKLESPLESAYNSFSSISDIFFCKDKSYYYEFIVIDRIIKKILHKNHYDIKI